MKPMRIFLALFVFVVSPGKGQSVQAEETVVDKEQATRIARTYLEQHSPGDRRKIISVSYVPPHGDSTSRGFWLVEFEPYAVDKPLPANTLTGVLIGISGEIRPRGARQLIIPEEREAIRSHAAQLGELLEAKRRKAAER